jgi:hypothetical protein
MADDNCWSTMAKSLASLAAMAFSNATRPGHGAMSIGLVENRIQASILDSVLNRAATSVSVRTSAFKIEGDVGLGSDGCRVATFNFPRRTDCNAETAPCALGRLRLS